MNEIVVTQDPITTPVAPAPGVDTETPVKVGEVFVQTQDEVNP